MTSARLLERNTGGNPDLMIKAVSTRPSVASAGVREFGKASGCVSAESPLCNLSFPSLIKLNLKGNSTN